MLPLIVAREQLAGDEAETVGVYANAELLFQVYPVVANYESRFIELLPHRFVVRKVIVRECFEPIPVINASRLKQVDDAASFLRRQMQLRLEVLHVTCPFCRKRITAADNRYPLWVEVRTETGVTAHLP